MKLFFRPQPNQFAHCSGQYAGSPQIVMTAAQCVVDENGNTYPGITLAAARVPGKRETKFLEWDCHWVDNNHYEREINRTYDHVLFNMTAPKSTNEYHLTASSCAINSYQEFWGTGFPGNFNKGNILVRIQGSKWGVGDRFAFMKKKPFGPGSGGGAWIGDVNGSPDGRRPQNVLPGINAFILSNSDLKITGSPLLDNVWLRLLEIVRNGKSCFAGRR